MTIVIWWSWYVYSTGHWFQSLVRDNCPSFICPFSAAFYRLQLELCKVCCSIIFLLKLWGLSNPGNRAAIALTYFASSSVTKKKKVLWHWHQKSPMVVWRCRPWAEPDSENWKFYFNMAPWHLSGITVVRITTISVMTLSTMALRMTQINIMLSVAYMPSLLYQPWQWIICKHYYRWQHISQLKTSAVYIISENI